MSADSEGDDPTDYAVGYGRPPAEHQFKKGRSGNRKGRPRRQERALTPRQFRRDVFEVAEMVTTVQTPDGPKRMTFAQALIRLAAQRATKGHGPSLRLFMNWYLAALADHFAAHAKEFDLLESFENRNSLYPEDLASEFSQGLLNSYRKGTRRP